MLKKSLIPLYLLLAGLSFASLSSAQLAVNQTTNSMYTLPHDKEVLSITVKFIEGSGIRFENNAFSYQVNDRLARGINVGEIPADITRLESMLVGSGFEINRTVNWLTENEVNQLRIAGEGKTKSDLPDMNLYQTIWLPKKSLYKDIQSLVAKLNELVVVQTAYADPVPEPPHHVATPNFEANQGYLQAPPHGINAELAWTYNNGQGQGVKIIDIEGGWNRSHEDLPAFFYDSGNDVPGWQSHGTAVLGVMSGIDNGYGVTGIANQSQIGVQSFGVNNDTIPGAIMQAASQLSNGDVLLIELQVAGTADGTDCSCNFDQCHLLPVEFYQGSFDAIQIASANGIIVVEAAGNGSVDLDTPVYNNIFDRTFRDSGAIMVGAGRSTQRSPMCFTNFGSRIDVHGWGEDVATTGYGDLYRGSHNNINQFYTSDFSGTSSASPIVAGAVAVVQGIAADLSLSRLDSNCMRDLLVSSGTNQTGDLSRKIGPLPDLGQAILNIGDCTGTSPVITTAKTAWGNHYAIKLEGSDFGTNPSIQVRADSPNSAVLDTYSGNFIYNTSDNILRFPIVEPDQQAVLRNPGLCFKVINNLGSSNEQCTQRVNDVQQGDFLGSPVQSYSSGQDRHFDSYIVKGGGSVLKLFGDSWKKVAYDYDITPNTVLEFNFKSTHQEPEIAGIGFIMSDGSGGGISQRFWQLYGLQTTGIQSHNNYTGTQEKSYKIRVGEVLQGQISHMVFIGDEDNRRGQNTVFISPTLSEEEIDIYDDVPAQRAYSDDLPGDAVSIYSNAPAQIHNFHDAGDGDWTIFSMGNGDGYNVRTTQLGSASARMIAYRVDGAFTEISPGRWDITQSDLTHVADDFSSGNNSILLQNTTGEVQAYVIRTFSSGPSGNGTDYSIKLTQNRPVLEVDAYDNVPSQRAYSDDAPGDAVPIAGNAAAQSHNFHDVGDADWTIFSMPSGSSVTARTTQLGSASAKMIAYRVDGAFNEISPGRWDITQSDLTHVSDDFSTGNNAVLIQNNTGAIQAYVIQTFSSGPAGNGTNYSISLTVNNP